MDVRVRFMDAKIGFSRLQWAVFKTNHQKNVKSPNDWQCGVYANVKRRVFTVNK